MIKKNDILDLTIEDLGVNGEGIGKVGGYTLFVKDGVIGDKVTVKVMKDAKFSALITRSSLDLRRIKCTTTLCESVVRAIS